MKLMPLALALAVVAPGQMIKLEPLEDFSLVNVPAAMQDFRHTYFLLTNESDRPVTAITAVWAFVSIDTGQRRPGVIKTLDSYMLDKRRFRPVVGPGQRIVLDPGAAAAPAFADAKDRKITIAIDAVVFEDGEIIGPDALNTGDDIAARYQAAREVAAHVHLGVLNGRNQEEIIEGAYKSGDTPMLARWRGHFVGKIATSVRQNPRATVAHLADLDNLPEPPKFWKKEK